MRRAARSLTDRYDLALKPVGLKVTQFSLLRTVSRMSSPSLTELAHEMGLDRSTLGRNVALLEREGLVRVASGTGDLRERPVDLTPAAVRLLARALPLWEDTERSLRRRLGKQSVHTLYELLSCLEEPRR
jgi:DNA-binding MarR family transcriptional regulator